MTAQAYSPGYARTRAKYRALYAVEDAPTPPVVEWTPQEGPQTSASECLADELYYGGAAGGGKSDLLIGLTMTRHHKSIIFRREFTQLKDLIGRAREVAGEHGRYNGTDHILRLTDGRVIEFGAVQLPHHVNKYKGRPHDAKLFDELPEFTEYQYRFLNGWKRTVRAGQRTRTVAAGNPPTSHEGEWVIRHWAPWLDRQHANPALPGELRWYAMIDGEEQEREDATPFMWKGETISPTSRTFIPAQLSDNPLLMATGYATTLQGLPEPLRSQLLRGDFSVGLEDDPYQTIPTAWVLAAQQRWKERQRPTIIDHRGNTVFQPMTAVGVDPARGGDDKTCLARRYGNWCAPIETHPGKATPDGGSVAQLTIAALLDGGVANIDVIGIGASVYDMSKQQGATVQAINFAESAPGLDRTGKLSFVNLRAYAYWWLREALDPVNGDDLALPPDPELLADLCSPKWMIRSRGIQIESKDDIKARLGRSPDKGDALVMAFVPPPVVAYATSTRYLGQTRGR